MFRSVKMGTEFHTFLTDLAQAVQAEDLKAAAIRQDGPRPGGEAMQAAVPGHEFVARAQVEMVGVAENDRRADGREVVRRDGLDGTDGSHGHEDGRRNIPVRRVDDARARRAVPMLQSVRLCHVRRVAGCGCGRKPGNGCFRSRNLLVFSAGNRWPASGPKEDL